MINNINLSLPQKELVNSLMRQTQSILSFEAINSFGEQRMVRDLEKHRKSNLAYYYRHRAKCLEYAKNHPKKAKDKLIEHHKKYKEIHGMDETIWITQSEHKKLHNRLRREGKCKIPVDKLTIIAQNAHQRTQKRKSNLYNYNTFIKKKIQFVEQVGLNVQLYERIIYNQNTGHVFISSGFMKNGYRILPIINENSEKIY